ncbi:hypothetical protein KR222_003494, partial [Zaprionus bogoriensis]
MEIDTDLTTTETLDDLDELDAKLLLQEAIKVKQEQEQQAQPKREATPEPTQQPQSQSQPQPTALKAELDTETQSEPAATAAEIKMADSSAAQRSAPPPAGKITRSNLNGARSPNVLKRLRKSTRSTRFKSKLTARGAAGGGGTASGAGNGSASSNGAANGHSGAALAKTAGKAGGGGGVASSSLARSRRTLFKRPAQKTPRVQACTRFVKSLFYKGSYLQIGDIVSIVDSEQRVYYAQIRGLLVDAYCEKSAFLTWLIPTQDSPDPREGFDPATYLIGPDEELSRKLCYLDFIMHAPSNYYYDRTTPFPLPDADEYMTQRGYIWTRLPTIKRER